MVSKSRAAPDTARRLPPTRTVHPDDGTQIRYAIRIAFVYTICMPRSSASVNAAQRAGYN